MKKNLFLFLILATTSTSAFATLQDLASEYSPIQPIKEIAQKTIELSGALSGTLEKSPTAIIQEQLNDAFDDDKMLEFYLSTPKEKRQYLFPMIHIAPFISHKIKSHPEILVWKNKQPTIIAPKLQEFAKKHLHNLSPYYYNYLDPDFWKELPKEEVCDPSMISQEKAPALAEKGLDYVYPTIKEIFKLAGKNSSDYFKTSLTLDDLANFSAVIADLDNFVPATIEKENLLVLVSQQTNKQPFRAIGDPFLMYLFSLEKIGEKETFEAFVQKYGFKNAEEFALKADQIVKAYNAMSLNLLVASYINQHKEGKSIKQPTRNDFGQEDIHVMDMYTRMNSSKPGDVYFVKKYKDQIKPILKTNFVKYGIMFYID